MAGRSKFISKFKTKFEHIDSIIPDTTIASFGPQVSKPTMAKTSDIYTKIRSNKQIEAFLSQNIVRRSNFLKHPRQPEPAHTCKNWPILHETSCVLYYKIISGDLKTRKSTGLLTLVIILVLPNIS